MVRDYEMLTYQSNCVHWPVIVLLKRNWLCSKLDEIFKLKGTEAALKSNIKRQITIRQYCKHTMPYPQSYELRDKHKATAGHFLPRY